ncbi:unnamed protein product [Echinostoma caproni]|uniref:Uncharacterized protein n=1 Tax=Echinostoma caproni TaxID=27848 RepID=A0A183BFF6_9TREM|nr:unnamed protein product [Echinostoma caproni]
MQNCSIALNHLEYKSDLDALHTLESNVRCLPAEMQTLGHQDAELQHRPKPPRISVGPGHQDAELQHRPKPPRISVGSGKTAASP